MSGLSAEMPPGVLIAAGDVLLIFDHLQLSFQRGGVVGVAAAAPAAMGTQHGVYATAAGGRRVQAYLHKPSPAGLARWDAVSSDGTVQIDTGLVWWDVPSTQRLVALAQEPTVAGLLAPGRPPPGSLNLYGDLLLPLAASTEREAYLAEAGDGPATPALQSARRTIWERLRGLAFSVERLQPAVFAHFGTSREYWEMAAGDPQMARLCGWTGAGEAAGNGPVLINAAVGQPVGDEPGPPTAGGEPADAGAAAREPALVTDSDLAAGLSWRGAALVANVQTGQALALGRDVVVDQLPLAVGGWVTRVFGLGDDPKPAWEGPGATFLNRPWVEWLVELVGSEASEEQRRPFGGAEESGGAHDTGLVHRRAIELLWPHMPRVERTLWNARLYPVAEDREESLGLALPLQGPGEAPAGWWERWLGARRLSLAESFRLADGERMLAGLAGLEDELAARSFCAAVAGETPAAEAKRLLGATPGALRRRAAPAAARIARDDAVAGSCVGTAPWPKPPATPPGKTAPSPCWPV